MSYVHPWEYQSGSCDVWQLAHLCNHMAERGWEPLAITDGSPGQMADRDVRYEGPDMSNMYTAIAPKVVLFRRPSGWSDEEAGVDA